MTANKSSTIILNELFTFEVFPANNIGGGVCLSVGIEISHSVEPNCLNTNNDNKRHFQGGTVSSIFIPENKKRTFAAD